MFRTRLAADIPPGLAPVATHDDDPDARTQRDHRTGRTDDDRLVAAPVAPVAAVVPVPTAPVAAAMATAKRRGIHLRPTIAVPPFLAPTVALGSPSLGDHPQPRKHHKRSKTTMEQTIHGLLLCLPHPTFPEVR